MTHEYLPDFHPFRVSKPVYVPGLFHGQHSLARLILSRQHPPVINTSHIVSFQGHRREKPHFAGIADKVATLVKRTADGRTQGARQDGLAHPEFLDLVGGRLPVSHGPEAETEGSVGYQ